MAFSNETTNDVVKTLGYIADREKVVNPLWTEFLTMESFDCITNQMLLMEKYEMAFAIQPKENPSPISLATMNSATDVYTDSLLEKTLSRLIRAKVFEMTGLNIIDFLALPTYMCQMIIRSITEIRKEDSPVLSKIQKEL